jgi:hypothetical protein
LIQRRPSDCNSLLFSEQFPDVFGGQLASSELSQAARQTTINKKRGLNGKPSKRQKACSATGT